MWVCVAVLFAFRVLAADAGLKVVVSAEAKGSQRAILSKWVEGAIVAAKSQSPSFVESSACKAGGFCKRGVPTRVLCMGEVAQLLGCHGGWVRALRQQSEGLVEVRAFSRRTPVGAAVAYGHAYGRCIGSWRARWHTRGPG